MLDFRNRIAKMMRHTSKWARRQGITCYRIYDHDIPDYPFSVDIYDGRLYIAEYFQASFAEAPNYQDTFDACLAVIAEETQIPTHQVFVKQRLRQKGNSQYQKTGSEKNEFIVQENNLRFKVNLSDYLDTGLFLDHRNTRKMVYDRAKNTRFLNLFAYTGAFTVYAAAAGATQTLTVDLSNTYLQWAKHNLAANLLTNAKQHQFLQTDVKKFLLEADYPDHFDLAVLDPPTFSNSKRMDEILDTQRDHVQLINQTLRLLKPNGTLFFSTNYRRFKLHTEAIQATSITNITTTTIPPDFRDKRIHQCYLIVK
jgi:23S rRNA (cytosine1962-C5)-methyltransferase